MTNDLTLKLDRARWWLLSNLPFYGQLTMGLTDVLGHPEANTACTDGRHIYWNPGFLSQLTEEETRGVLAHEALHCAHGHLWRLPLDERGNMAGDYAINLNLQDIPGLALPAGVLLDDRYTGMAEEEILAALPQPEPDPEPQPAQGDGQDQGDGQSDGDATGAPGVPDPGGCGSFVAPAQDPRAGQDPASQAVSQGALKEDWERRVIQAVQAAQSDPEGCGVIPADLQRILNRIAAITPDWRQETADFLKNTLGDRNDWSRSSRRMGFPAQPVLYPRKQRDRLGLPVIIRDTSGSVDDRLLATFNAHIHSLTSAEGCGAIIIDADTDVRAVYRIDPGEYPPTTAEGGGGTDFTPAFQEIARLQEAGELLSGIIYITDLHGPEPSMDLVDSLGLPLLWACTTTRTARSGRTIRISHD